MKKQKIEEIKIGNTIAGIRSHFHEDHDYYIRDGTKIMHVAGPGPVAPDFTKCLVVGNPPIYPINYVNVDKEKLLSAWEWNTQKTYIRSDTEEDVRFEILKNNGITFMTNGWIQVIFYEDIYGELVPVPYLVPTITRALRQQKHVEYAYRLNDKKKLSEISRLETIQDHLNKISFLLTHWQHAGKLEQAALEKDLAYLIKLLENCTNKYKVWALDQILDVSAMEDTKGRKNPPAWAARIRRAISDIDTRLKQIAPRLSRSVFRFELLKFEFNFIEAQREAAIRELMLLMDPKNISILGSRKRAETAIYRLQYHIHRFWVSPYYVVYKDCEIYLREALKMAIQKDIPTAKKHLLAVLHILTNEISHQGIIPA